MRGSAQREALRFMISQVFHYMFKCNDNTKCDTRDEKEILHCILICDQNVYVETELKGMRLRLCC